MDKCPYCFQKYDKSKRDKIVYNRRAANARRSSKKAVENGNHLHGRNKSLSPADVCRVRKLYRTKKPKKPSMRELAKKFGVSATVIHRILNNNY